MSVTDKDTVDAVGVEKTGGHVVLLISDHLDWTDEQAHLEVLQEKINTYLRFIESGELLDAYPNARGRQPVIKVVGAHALSPAGIHFFEQVVPIVRDAGIDLQFAMLRQSRS